MKEFGDFWLELRMRYRLFFAGLYYSFQWYRLCQKIPTACKVVAISVEIEVFGYLPPAGTPAPSEWSEMYIKWPKIVLINNPVKPQVSTTVFFRYISRSNILYALSLINSALALLVWNLHRFMFMRLIIAVTIIVSLSWIILIYCSCVFHKLYYLV